MSSRLNKVGLTVLLVGLVGLAIVMYVSTTGLSTTLADSTVIFSEDFESYVAGSDLDGQGGWTRTRGSDNSHVDVSAQLGTQASIGLSRIDVNELVFIDTSMSWDGTGVLVLEYDAYAEPGVFGGCGNNCVSHDSGVQFVTGGGTFLGWFANCGSPFCTAFPPGWQFNPRSGGLEIFENVGYDQKVHIEVIIDAVNEEIYGRITLSDSSVVESTHFTTTGLDLTDITIIRITQDFRGTKGVDIDNILVTRDEGDDDDGDDDDGDDDDGDDDEVDG